MLSGNSGSAAKVAYCITVVGVSVRHVNSYSATDIAICIARVGVAMLSGNSGSAAEVTYCIAVVGISVRHVNSCSATDVAGCITAIGIDVCSGNSYCAADVAGRIAGVGVYVVAGYSYVSANITGRIASVGVYVVASGIGGAFIAFCLARGGGHIGGDFLTKEQKCKLRVVNEDVSGAGDGLHRVVTTEFPCVNGILLHPFKKDIHALYHTVGAPSIVLAVAVCVFPTNVYVKEDTRHVTAHVVRSVGFTVGVIVAAALTVAFVASGEVFTRGGGTEHHNVVLVSALKSLAVGPGMLTVPRRTAVPGRTYAYTGVERGDLAIICITAILAVGILEEGSACVIIVLVGVRICHKLV